MCTGFLCGCARREERRETDIRENREEQDEPVMRYHPMYYRFHRYIPRRRMWMPRRGMR
ncbi:MAG: hypothetical protein FWC70_12525 [Defluviitaleaceae bacterium]|nr:hypothetical protein [Defluviitaleaceae bacterium]